MGVGGAAGKRGERDEGWDEISTELFSSAQRRVIGKVCNTRFYINKVFHLHFVIGSGHFPVTHEIMEKETV
jgi:hypothetical protein